MVRKEDEQLIQEECLANQDQPSRVLHVKVEENTMVTFLQLHLVVFTVLFLRTFLCFSMHVLYASGVHEINLVFDNFTCSY